MDNRNHTLNTDFRLEISRNGESLRTVHIGSSGILVGRSKKCDVRLPLESLAAQHVRVAPKNGFCYIQSLKKNTGVSVNGFRTRYQCLRDGDVITLGPFDLTFHSSGGRNKRQTDNDVAQQKRAFREAARGIEDKKTKARPPIHPLAIAAMGFIGLAFWFWAFGVGAIVLGVYSLAEIRSHNKYRGMGLAVGVICAGLIVGAFDACQRAGGWELLITSDTAAQTCKTNLRAIGEALKRYAEDNREQLPANLEDLYPEYVSDPSILHCPSAEASRPGSGYVFPGSSQQSLPPESVVVLDNTPRHHHGTGGFLLRASGSVEWINAPTFKMELMNARESLRNK